MAKRFEIVEWCCNNTLGGWNETSLAIKLLAGETQARLVLPVWTLKDRMRAAWKVLTSRVPQHYRAVL